VEEKLKKELMVCRICRIVIYIWKYYEHDQAFKQTARYPLEYSSTSFSHGSKTGTTSAWVESD